MRIRKEALFLYTCHYFINAVALGRIEYLQKIWALHCMKHCRSKHNYTSFRFKLTSQHRLHAHEIWAWGPLNCIRKAPHNWLQQHQYRHKMAGKKTNTVTENTAREYSLLKTWENKWIFLWNEVKIYSKVMKWETNLWVSRAKLITFGLSGTP